MLIEKFTNVATSATVHRLNLAYSKALQLLDLEDRNDPSQRLLPIWLSR